MTGEGGFEAGVDVGGIAPTHTCTVGGVKGEQGAEYHREDERDSGKEEALRRLSKMHVELDRSEATRERGYTTALFKLMRPHLTVMCACWQWSLQAVLRVDVTRYLLTVGCEGYSVRNV